MDDEKFRDRYRITSARLPGWNYASVGWYFVTVCTKDRICSLSDIVAKADGNYEVQLSDIGKIVLSELLETQIARPNIFIDTFVIMPNHVHILLEIHDDTGSLKKRGTLQPNSLGAIIGWWKSAATKRISAIDDAFAWQPRFYDAIVRDETSLVRIRRYIKNNPRAWYRDRNNPDGVYM